MRQITGKMRDECSQRRVCPRVLTGQVLVGDIIIPRLPSSRGTLRPPQEFWDFWFGHLRNFGIYSTTYGSVNRVHNNLAIDRSLAPA